MNFFEKNKNDDSSLVPIEIFGIIFFTGFFVFLSGGILGLLGGNKIGLLGEIFIIVPAAIYVFSKKLDVKKIFRLHPISQKVFISSIALGIIAFILIDAMDRLIATYFPMPQEQLDFLTELLTITSFADGIFIFLSAVIFASIAEEMFFRGLVQRNLELYSDPAMTMVFVSVFFALTHLSFEVALQILILGLLLAYTSWKALSIYPAIIIHALNNSLSLLLLNLPDNSTHWYASQTNVQYHWTAMALLLLIPVFKFFNKTCEDKNNGQPL
jgi:membrane protease YdiL (CAAX protease family)